MKAFKITLISILSVILISLTLLSSILLSAFTTPNILPFVLRNVWNDVSSYVPVEYTNIESEIKVERDLRYPSKFNNNILDIYYQKDVKEKQPTVLWIHGGGFVAGTKDSINVFSTLLANEGFTVVSMNYDLAPESNYPNPLIQVGEVIKFIKSLEDTYLALDTKRLVIGGDSAGAHIAANFAAKETNPLVSKGLNLDKVLTHEIKGLLLYCGPYDLMKFDNMFKTKDLGSSLLEYFVNQIGWSYFGTKNWRNDSKLEYSNIVEIITKDFPSSYITDGNVFSFMDHGIALEDELKRLDVTVESYYPSNENADKEYFHEYQFDFENNKIEAFNNLNKTINFLNDIFN